MAFYISLDYLYHYDHEQSLRAGCDVAFGNISLDRWVELVDSWTLSHCRRDAAFVETLGRLSSYVAVLLHMVTMRRLSLDHNIIINPAI